jgi:hypothetical protein
MRLRTMKKQSQNKPNSNPIKACPERSRMGQFLQRPKMNENLFATKDYENISDWTLGENKPKQTQFYLPPGEPVLLALRLVRRSFSEDGSFSEGGSAAEGGRAMIFFGAFLQRVAARPEKNVGNMNLLAIKSYKFCLNYVLLL